MAEVVKLTRAEAAPEDQFRQAIAAEGLTPPRVIVLDGALHRFASGEKDRNDRDGAGWYIGWSDGVPAGSFGCWREGITKQWTASGRLMSSAEHNLFRQRMLDARAKRDAAHAEVRREAAAAASRIWESSQPAPPDHPYLARKGIQPHCAKVDSRGHLVLPLYDAAGSLSTVQRIAPDGGKLYLAGGATRGCFATIGTPDPAGPLYIAEGFATAATVYEVTGCACFVAYSAGNLPPVAASLRQRYGPAALLVVVADNDASGTGEKKAKQAAADSGVRVVMPPEPGDANDYRDAGGDLAALLASVEVMQSRLRVLDFDELLNLDVPPREMMLSPWLPTQGIVMVYAARGAGKTHFALGTAYAVATGGGYLNFEAPKPRRVLYVDGEMPLVAMQERLRMVAAASHVRPAPGYLRLVTPDVQNEGIPDVATIEGQRAIEELLDDDTELLILDNLSALVRSGEENAAESWGPIRDFGLNLRRRGVTLLFIHHAGKGGQQRGTSKREDLLDTVVALRLPGDYAPTDGARFEVHFEKHRGFRGKDADPFEAKLEADDNGAAVWTIQSLEDYLTRRVADLKAEGLSVREIAEELSGDGRKVGKSTIHRHLKKAAAMGLLS